MNYIFLNNENIKIMKYILTYNEKITLDIKVGDEILGGRFKNKKIVVKSISKDEHGDPKINGKPLLKFRTKKQKSE